MRTLRLLLLLLSSLCVLATAQTTTVNVQVTDSGGQTWNNGTYSIQLISQPGANPGPWNYLGNPVTTTYQGTMNGTGAFSLPLYANTILAPALSTYGITVCSNTSPVSCFTQQFQVQVSSPQSLTVAPPAITINMSAPPYIVNVVAYSDIEVIGAVGNTYFNIVSLAQKICTAPTGCPGSGWTASGVIAGVSSVNTMTGGVTLPDLNNTGIVVKIQGGTIPTSAKVLGTNGSGQPVAASSADVQSVIGAGVYQASGSYAASNAAVTINGVSCVLSSSCAPYGGVVTYTSAHTIGAADIGKLVVMNCTSACTLTFQASPANTDWFGVESIGSTLATISLNGKNFNGASAVPVLNGFRDLRVGSDGTNFFGDAPLVQGTNVTFTAASNGFTLNASGGGGSVGPGTVGFIPSFATTTTVGNSHCDDGATTPSTVTCSEPVTIQGKTTTAATNTSNAGLNLPHGTAPTAPANGDVWTTTNGIYTQINGTTIGPLNSAPPNAVAFTTSTTLNCNPVMYKASCASSCTATLPSSPTPGCAIAVENDGPGTVTLHAPTTVGCPAAGCWNGSYTDQNLDTCSTGLVYTTDGLTYTPTPTTTYGGGITCSHTAGSETNSVVYTLPSVITTQLQNLGGTCLGQIYTAATSLTAFTAVVANSSNQVTTAATNSIPILGVTQGTTGQVDVCFIGLTSMVMDGTATSGHIALLSSTVGGEGHDSGISCCFSNIPYYNVLLGTVITGCTGAGCTAQVSLLGPAASGQEFNIQQPGVTCGGTAGCTAGTIPTGCDAGHRGLTWLITDSTSPTFNAQATGGSSTVANVYCNGSTYVWY